MGLGPETMVLRLDGLHDPEARHAVVLRAESLLMPGLSVRSPRVACIGADDAGGDDPVARAVGSSG